VTGPNLQRPRDAASSGRAGRHDPGVVAVFLYGLVARAVRLGRAPETLRGDADGELDETMEDRTSVRIKNLFSHGGLDDLGDLGAGVAPPPTRPFEAPRQVPRVCSPRAVAV